MTKQQIDYDRIAEIYDLYVTADYDVPFFLEETAKVQGAVLELTSGTGRLSLPLIETGVQLTCVDGSQGMLDILSSKLQERGLNADIVCADISQLQLQGTFELAILPFQSFLEIVGESHQRQALASIYACLTPGGRLICPVHNPPIRRSQVDGSLRLVGQFPTPDGSLVVSGFEQGGHPVVNRLQFFEFFGHDGQLLSKQLLPMKFELIDKDRFESMAQESGFRILNLYGNYDRSPFDDHQSPVMIWILGKSDSS